MSSIQKAPPRSSWGNAAAAGVLSIAVGREVTSVLTVHPDQRWELAGGAKLYDVTHLPCRAARYTPAAGGGDGSPATARASDFPVTPGGPMPPVAGCDKQDYAVVFVTGVAEK